MWLFTGIMIYDSISNYAISVNLSHFTGLLTDTVLYDMFIMTNSLVLSIHC